MTVVRRSALETTAIDACLAGGRHLRRLFESGETTVDRFDHDVKSSADRESESAMLEVIRSRYPEHAIDAEESGRVGGDGGEGGYEWIVDPLDGTNNFESGLASFASAVAVTSSERTELGVAYVPLLDDLYVARAGDGVRYNGRAVPRIDRRNPDRDSRPSTATVVSVIGHDVKRDPDRRETADAIERAVESRCKRRLESWSPTVHWGLLARGRLDGIYCYRPDREEQVLGELFARESGLHAARGEEWFVAAASPDLRSELLEIVGDCVDEATG